MVSPVEQRALIERAQEGDTRAFEQLIAEHIALVRRYARAFVGDETAAGDLAQEVLLKAYRSIRQYQFRSAFSTWLYTITRNVCIDQTRTKKARERRAHASLDEVGDVATDADGARAELLARERREQLWTAVGKLPPKFRSIVVLVDLEGLSYGEAGEIEGVAVGTVRSRLSRGRKQLREILSKTTLFRDAGNHPQASIVQEEETEPV